MFVKPRVFVSFHHQQDQHWYESLREQMARTHDLVDRSLAEPFQSDDPEYVERQIREKHITGTSCTIVLLGSDTHKRKYVDWEICATLYKQHGLLGLRLPDNYGARFPARFQDNIDSGYAVLAEWTVDAATLRWGASGQRNSVFIRNARIKMTRNVP